MWLKKLEWEALEYIIRVPDAQWSETLGVQRFAEAKNEGEGMRERIRRIVRNFGGQKDVVEGNESDRRRRKANAKVVEREKAAWAKGVRARYSTPRHGEDDVEPRKRYALDISNATTTTVWPTTKNRSTDSGRVNEEAERGGLASSAAQPREAAKNCTVTNSAEAARHAQEPFSGPYEPPEMDCDESDEDFRPSTHVKRVTRQGQSHAQTSSLVKRMLERRESAPAVLGQNDRASQTSPGGQSEGIVDRTRQPPRPSKRRRCTLSPRSP